ncbi:hypothetical protein BV898_16503 [Hypsibius exemplaris]|uniref:Uncharacterized protein n=1 Tax=Hypsibius exemplaris TaxID=2072580 RepID=A0A9X6NDS6_HYPEX|nr:hypothetical protein BV898_16503 [Hypsibius exemplaris]
MPRCTFKLFAVCRGLSSSNERQVRVHAELASQSLLQTSSRPSSNSNASNSFGRIERTFVESTGRLERMTMLIVNAARLWNLNKRTVRKRERFVCNSPESGFFHRVKQSRRGRYIKISIRGKGSPSSGPSEHTTRRMGSAMPTPTPHGKEGLLHISAPCIYAEVLAPPVRITAWSCTKATSSTHSSGLQEFLQNGLALRYFDFAPPVFLVANGLSLGTAFQRYDRIYVGAACEHIDHVKDVIKFLKIGGQLAFRITIRVRRRNFGHAFCHFNSFFRVPLAGAVRENGTVGSVADHLDAVLFCELGASCRRFPPRSGFAPRKL